MVQKRYHCVYDIHYHLVFPVKYRKALLEKHIEQKIKEVSLAIEERYEITMESIGLDQDHIHILCSAHPEYSIGMIVQRYKSIAAKELWGREFWFKARQTEGGVRSLALPSADLSAEVSTQAEPIARKISSDFFKYTPQVRKMGRFAPTHASQFWLQIGIFYLCSAQQNAKSRIFRISIIMDS